MIVINILSSLPFIDQRVSSGFVLSKIVSPFTLTKVFTLLSELMSPLMITEIVFTKEFTASRIALLKSIFSPPCELF